ncbi:MAG TPA: DNA translocase FtsK [Candidatus Omnitrophota bacterium]|nr:DNA translocase FtsK [Candidatus Omnitrophota bacterium]HPD85068.1 DNA translocase FtsK [Candidatus Omnitrophota bacterium]HRZ03926.1 DNA translocase FtsK [Candidatus Omnitrophota bacterium]
MKREQIINEIKAVVISAAAIILFASLISFDPHDLPWYTSHPNYPAHNLIRIFGAYLAGGLFFVLGYSAYAIVAFLLFWSWDKFSSKELKFSLSKLISFIVMFCVLGSLFSMIGLQAHTARFQRGGLLGIYTSDFLISYFGRIGAYVILLTLGLLALILIGEFLVSPFLFKIVDLLKEKFGFLKDRIKEGRVTEDSRKAVTVKLPNIEKQKAPKPDKSIAKLFKGKEEKPDKSEPISEPAPAPKPQIRVSVPESKEARSSTLIEKPLKIGEYNLPTLDLLKDSPPVSARQLQEDLEGGAKVLEETLAEFGVRVRVADVERGPVITRYELDPAPGVKVQQIATLSDDIALAMKAQTVRIVAPIPGKDRVGVEVPNTSSSLVFLKDVLANGDFRKHKSKLTLALGKDIAGQSLFADLGQMPHLLIAGTTGAGKTVCVNSLIMSMLFNASPDEVKFIFVDPKMVELSIYSSLPHALCPAVTDPKKVSAALNWVVGEMEARYSLLAKDGVRNIEAYNAKERRLPYIVVIVDELADLMQVAANHIESAITRLAQLSRAVGIHLILATQRPSVDVITGVIKANFPARISFKVASKVDSRTVLDMNGAEKLLGRGDMLFMKPGEAKPIRGQCSYVSDEEIQNVIDFVKTQQEPLYDENILKQQASNTSGAPIEKDELYDEALRLVIETNQPSVTILQRRMRLGYTRAARLIDMMEQNGIIGPYCGSKARELLINREEWLKNNIGQPQ